MTGSIDGNKKTHKECSHSHSIHAQSKYATNIAVKHITPKFPKNGLNNGGTIEQGKRIYWINSPLLTLSASKDKTHWDHFVLFAYTC